MHFFITDPRTKEWPMMSSPFPTLAICLAYVYLVKVNNKFCFIMNLKKYNGSE